MATTRLIPLHIGEGRTFSTAIEDIIDYVENPEKTDFGKLIYGYECDTRTADAEFTLAKRQYINRTGRKRGADDVIAYHFRQAFKPGEVTPEEANQIGRELAMKLTKGKNAFIVCTHIDKHHIHNHIIVSSVDLDCSRKFRNFWGSAWALRRISDKLCLEHGLSIVEDPKPSRGHYGKWLGESNKPLSFQNQIRLAIDRVLDQRPSTFEDFLKMLEADGVEVTRRGKSINFRVSGQEKPTHCNTLKGDYTEQAIRERIAGIRSTSAAPRTKSNIKMLIDIDAAIRSGKGTGYERWAKVFNVKQLAQAVSYLKENSNMNYAELQAKVTAATSRFNELSEQIKAMETRLSNNGELQKQIVNYSKTRAVYIEYRKAGYSKKFRAEHEADILIHQAAKKYFDGLGVQKLPTVKALREEYSEVLEAKRKAYAEYKQARAEMRELQNVKANIDYLLGPSTGKDNTRQRQ